jgi:hypothetical protein
MCLIKCGITNAIETLGDGTIQYIMPHIIRHCGRRLAQLPPLRLASRLVNLPTETSVLTPGWDWWKVKSRRDVRVRQAHK